MKDRTPFVKIEGSDIVIHIKGKTTALALSSLGPDLIDWFIQGRKAGYESLAQGKGPGPLFSRHLPVIATSGDKEFFPTRLANKGVGFLPQEDRIEEQVKRYEALLTRTMEQPVTESLRQRLEAAAELFHEPGSVDPRLLGSLEIFAGGTYENLMKRPFASLLFTDPSHRYRSFQLDCAVQIIEPPDPRFKFLQLARSIFEHDPFHVTQPGFHCAYLFWIVDIHDKTPRPVREDSVPHKL